jgi:hypothetical protein
MAEQTLAETNETNEESVLTWGHLRRKESRTIVARITDSWRPFTWQMTQIQRMKEPKNVKNIMDSIAVRRCRGLFELFLQLSLSLYLAHLTLAISNEYFRLSNIRNVSMRKIDTNQKLYAAGKSE